MIKLTSDEHLIPVIDLQHVCRAEGYNVSRDSLATAYTSKHPLDLIDVPALSNPDLRKTLLNLQLQLMGKPLSTRAVDTAVVSLAIPSSAENTLQQATEEWRWLRRHSDCMSFVDSFLRRRTTESPEVLAFEGTETSPDDELGYPVLYGSTSTREARDGMVFYRADENIAREAIRASRGTHEEWVPIKGADGQVVDQELFRARVEYQRELVDGLAGIMTLSGLMPQESAFLDYIPWVRELVRIDDMHEREAWDGREKEKSGRMTRNSMRAKHTRTIELDEGSYGKVMGTGLDCMGEWSGVGKEFMSISSGR